MKELVTLRDGSDKNKWWRRIDGASEVGRWQEGGNMEGVRELCLLNLLGEDWRLVLRERVSLRLQICRQQSIKTGHCVLLLGCLSTDF